MNKNINEINKQVLGMVKDGKMNKDLAQSILSALNNKSEVKQNKDIAIIGLSLRLPGVNNINDYWEVLKNGKSKIGCFPKLRREDTDLFLSKDQKLKKNPYLKAGYLDEIDKFDAGFFKISPKEATMMDPYQRLFLQGAYEAMEDAGYGGDSLGGSRTDVFVGVDHTPKLRFSYLNEIDRPSFLAMTGSWSGMQATKVSHLLNLRGASMVIDTGCSSSAVALHNACRALRDKECTMALAGGVNLLLFPVQENDMFGGVESNKGIVRPFDKNADGTLWGEGVGVVLLKPIKDAIEDGDHIYAVIKGSAVNNNGASSNAITALSAEAHKDLLLRAWQDAKINPETISYIEAHGTSSVIGDSIEISGINNAFREHSKKKNFCGIGSVKGNIGHLVSCSAMASLFKVILGMKNELIPSTINYQEPNPYVNFSDSSVYVVDKLTPWKKSSEVRRAGISCFSFTGTNCHIVVEEPPYNDKLQFVKNGEVSIFVLSCKTKEALIDIIENYKKYLHRNHDESISDICFTSCVGRGHYEFRIAMIIESIEDLREKINILSEKGFENNEIHGVYYGGHKIVSSTKHEKNAGEITEGEKRQLGLAINSKIRETVSSHKECQELFEEICSKYVKGADINWGLIYSEKETKRVMLPLYPFEKTRYWVELSHYKTLEENNNKEKVIVTHQLKEQDFSVVDRVIQKMREFERSKLVAETSIDESEHGNKKEDVFSLIEDYGRFMLLKVFKSMGILSQPGISYHKDTLIKELGIVDFYRKLFMALMNILEKASFVEIKDDIINASELVNSSETIYNIKNLENIKNYVVKKYSDMEAYFKLIENCVGNYDEILTGKTSALSIMFPNYSMDLVGDIYQGNRGVNYFNELVAISTRKYIEEKLNSNKDSQIKFKILEIGAGTGGTSEYIFTEISEFSDNIEYYYTDISLGFVNYGRKNYAAKYPFIKFRPLNMEKTIESQGFNQGEFDIIIAANVIHGMRNLKNSLNEVKKLLRTNGILILNEVTRVQDFTTLTFGLTSGWWAFEDEEVRIKYSPLLDRNLWKSLLRSIGFKNVNAFGDLYSDSSENQHSVLSVIVGESDGTFERDTSLDDAEYVIQEREGYGDNEFAEVKVKGRKDEVYTSTEKMVARIWAESLGFYEINIFDNFSDLGGDSIIAMKVVNIISTTMDKKIDMQEVLKKPSIAEFAAYLDEFVLHLDCNEDLEKN